MLDELDRQIIRKLQSNPSASQKKNAELMGLTLSSLQRRLEKLERNKIIKRKQALIDWSKLGFGVEVFLRVTLDKTDPRAWSEFLESAQKIDEISIIETLIGRVDVRMDARARDLAHYQEIYVDKILALPHISDIESLMLVSQVKDSRALPI